jgi:hypothetical protein
MAALFKPTGVAVAAGLGVLTMAAIGGFAAGFNARAGLGALGLNASDLAEMSASDSVSLRFPNDWTEAAAPAPMTLAFASADPGLALFDPTPVYPFATETALQPSVEVPERPRMPAQPAAAAPAKPAVAAATRAVHRSNAVLNDSQIASIKKRLNLTRDQERYWPAVEAELRKMEYKKDQKSGTRTAAVDMSKVNVEGLKSAGFPLVMSFSDDQRRELNSLAHLLGLESVMSTF